MVVFQKVMERTHLYSIDEFGIKNYNYGALGFFALLIFTLLNVSLGYVTFIVEIDAVNSPVKNYADALWLMLMSSTTIGFGDVYPVTLVGRIAVFVMFILGVGILGAVGAVFANKLLGFADTNIKNRELRKQNTEISLQNIEIYKKLEELEKKIEALSK